MRKKEEPKEPNINLDVLFDSVKAQARMVSDAYMDYGKALENYYGAMFIDPYDGSLNVSEDFGREVQEKFDEAQRQHLIFRDVFERYQRLKAEQEGE